MSTAFRLGDAAGDADEEVAAFGGRDLLQATHAPELGVDLLRRLFADMAGVENDEIGICGGCRLDIAFRRQGIRHTLRVVDVHLAAERLNIKLAGRAHSVVFVFSSVPPIQGRFCLPGDHIVFAAHRQPRSRRNTSAVAPPS